jgi:hypothetical protein
VILHVREFLRASTSNLVQTMITVKVVGVGYYQSRQFQRNMTPVERILLSL